MDIEMADNIMDKKQVLMDKMHTLLLEIDEAKKLVDTGRISYLENYKKGVENVMQRLQKGTLPPSKGGLIGTMRGISEYDSLASVKKLYDAAADVDIYYSTECKEW